MLLKNGLYAVPSGGKIHVLGDRTKYYPPLTHGPSMALDGRPAWLALDEALARENEEDFGADDEESREDHEAAVRAAVDAYVESRRRAKDARRARDESAGNLTSQNDRSGRDALPNREDHRQDFRSGDARARDSALGMDARASDRKRLLGLD